MSVDVIASTPSLASIGLAVGARLALWILCSSVLVYLLAHLVLLVLDGCAAAGEAAIKIRPETLYGVLRANIAADAASRRRPPREEEDATTKNREDYLVHPVYDFEEDRVVLLRVTRDRIERMATFPRPFGNTHATFDPSLGGPTATYERFIARGGDPAFPPLDVAVRTVRRDDLISSRSSNIRLREFASPVTVDIRGGDDGEDAFVVYENSSGDKLSMRLPATLRASVVVVNDSSGGGSGDDDSGADRVGDVHRGDNDDGIQIKLNRRSPCSRPSVVTRGDYRRYYLEPRSRRSARSGTRNEPSSRENDDRRVLSEFAWLCRDVDDATPILVRSDHD